MSENQIEKIRDRFVKVRKGLKKTQKEFAEAIGYKQGHISEMENGSKNISKAMFLALQDAFGVNRIWLETGEGEMFLSQNSGMLSEPTADYDIVGAMKKTIQTQERLIAMLEEENARLRAENEIFKSKDSRQAC